ncbi:MAG: hypothetical protein LBU95_05990, partial [Rikenellaceae bacterium]|nr:hypothetical protein [Rikenellaceae bacterium]
MKHKLAMIEKDPWLESSAGELEYRHDLYLRALAQIEAGGVSLVDFANGYRYYGFQYDAAEKGWWFR